VKSIQKDRLNCEWNFCMDTHGQRWGWLTIRNVQA
jgi:hypothetical protein